MVEIVYRAGRTVKRIIVPITHEPKVLLEPWCRMAGGVFEVTSRVPEEKPVVETYVCRFPTPTAVHISGEGYRIGRPERVTIRGMYGSIILDRTTDVNVMEFETSLMEKPARCKISFEQPPRFFFECSTTPVTEVSFEWNKARKRLRLVFK